MEYRGSSMEWSATEGLAEGVWYDMDYGIVGTASKIQRRRIGGGKYLKVWIIPDKNKSGATWASWFKEIREVQSQSFIIKVSSWKWLPGLFTPSGFWLSPSIFQLIFERRKSCSEKTAKESGKERKWNSRRRKQREQKQACLNDDVKLHHHKSLKNLYSAKRPTEENLIDSCKHWQGFYECSV